MSNKIFIIIPVFNRLNFTIDCLNSLRQQEYKNFKIILVDDGSTDGTYEYLEKNYPEIIVLKGNGSLWWTGATNMGVKKALELSSSKDDFILTLNNDLVVTREYLQELVNIFNKEKPCLVGSVAVNIKNSDKVEFVGSMWNRITAKYRRPKEFNNNYNELAAHNLFVKTDLLPGRGTLIPIIVFRQIGLFDEYNFPHYAADEDFSLRSKKNGFKLIVATRAIVKSYVEETGLRLANAKGKRKKSLKHLYESLTSIKSATKLRIRYNWAKRHTPVPPLYFLFDFLRIVYSFYFK